MALSNWRQRLHRLRWALLPLGTRRYQFVRSVYYRGKEILSLQFLRAGFHRFMTRPGGWFESRYSPENFGCTILFTDQADLFPQYPFRRSLSGPRTLVKVSLISTLKNERSSVERWMGQILRQTRLPNEIILVDGGSTDGTVELIETLAASSPVPLRLIKAPGVNIARGRNLAIEQAQYHVIASIDFGCQPEQTWLENIIAPFELDDQIEVVAGWYTAIDARGQVMRRKYWPVLQQVEPDSFIPSSRSKAFTKEVWQKASGYPEWLTMTGEDTYFALDLRRFSQRRAFVPDAVVQWFAPPTTLSYWRKVSYWSTGDGEIGLNSYLYFHTLKMLIIRTAFILATLLGVLLAVVTRAPVVILFAALLVISAVLVTWYYSQKTKNSLMMLLTEYGAMISQVSGYLSGVKRRSAVDQRRFAQARGIFFILAGVPIYDTGGGSRGAQIAFELLRQNFIVVYIHKFASYESVNLNLQFQHPNLQTYPLQRFAWKKFMQTHAQFVSAKPCRALVEFPLPEFIPLINQLRSAGAAVAYDLLDDWRTQLGSTWYNQEKEQQIIDLADVLIATAPVLAERLRELSEKSVNLLPNAVNHRLFNAACEFVKPADLPHGDFIITYVGALWGEWFDWRLLVKTAEAFPQAAVMVIGDYHNQCPASLPNLHFLGLKPQASLPAYLHYSQVAIIPWVENEITFATSPLKLYEYLAMCLPVVTPDLPLLYDIPNVYISKTSAAFLQNIERALNAPVLAAPLEEYINAHSWERRVKQLTAAFEQPSSPGAQG